MDAQLAAALVGGVVTLAGWPVMYLAGRRRNSADADNSEAQADKAQAETVAILSTQVRTLAEMVANQQAQLSESQSRARVAEAEVVQLRAEVATLRAEVAMHAANEARLVAELANGDRGRRIARIRAREVVGRRAMGQWSMHIEGHGIHDNGRPDDADAMLREFVEKLGESQVVGSASFTVGATKELVHPSRLDEGMPDYDDAALPHERAYRHAAH